MTISRSMSRSIPSIRNCIATSLPRSAGAARAPSQHVQFGRELVHRAGTGFGDHVRITEEHPFHHVFAAGMDLDAQSHARSERHVFVGPMRRADERTRVERVEDAVHEWGDDGVAAVLDDLAGPANILR